MDATLNESFTVRINMFSKKVLNLVFLLIRDIRVLRGSLFNSHLMFVSSITHHGLHGFLFLLIHVIRVICGFFKYPHLVLVNSISCQTFCRLLESVLNLV